MNLKLLSWKNLNPFYWPLSSDRHQLNVCISSLSLRELMFVSIYRLNFVSQFCFFSIIYPYYLQRPSFDHLLSALSSDNKFSLFLYNFCWNKHNNIFELHISGSSFLKGINLLSISSWRVKLLSFSLKRINLLSQLSK